MNPNPDLRIRRTRKLIWEALLTLMAEKGFTSITVNDICKQAMVHRTTFYKHYEDKYDLFRQGVTELFDEFTADAPPATEAAQTRSLDTPPEQVTRLFAHAAKNQKTYKTLLSGEGHTLYREIANQYIGWIILNRTTEIARETKKSQLPLDVISQYIAGAIVNLLQWWLERNMPYTPEQMAVYITKLSALGIYPSLGISFNPNTNH